MCSEKLSTSFQQKCLATIFSCTVNLQNRHPSQEGLESNHSLQNEQNDIMRPTVHYYSLRSNEQQRYDLQISKSPSWMIRSPPTTSIPLSATCKQVQLKGKPRRIILSNRKVKPPVQELMRVVMCSTSIRCKLSLCRSDMMRSLLRVCEITVARPWRKCYRHQKCSF